MKSIKAKALYTLQTLTDKTLGCYLADKAEDEGVYFNGEIKAILGEHFDIEVISIHTDDSSSTMGVWIVYQ